MKRSNTKAHPTFESIQIPERSTVENLRVLFEDNHLIVINKRSSDIVQADKSGDTVLSDIVKAYLKQKYHKPGEVFCGTVHRIDRPVSGVVVFAKTSKALSRLTSLFKSRDIQKTYWAVVQDTPPKNNDTVINYLWKDEKLNKSFCSNLPKGNAKESELSYKVTGKGNYYSFLEIQPKTGRHHQIRVTLSSLGCPIKGDVKYGAKRTNPNGGIHLHARAIEFPHPTKAVVVRIIAPVPEDNIWNAYLQSHFVL
ncbi:MAG: RluA family pseudouridine synthase [Bacteroidota bacterium]